jgi:hypothetical protein
VNDHIVPRQGVGHTGEADTAADAGELHDAKGQFFGRFRSLHHKPGNS